MLAHYPINYEITDHPLTLRGVQNIFFQLNVMSVGSSKNGVSHI